MVPSSKLSKENALKYEQNKVGSSANYNIH